MITLTSKIYAKSQSYKSLEDGFLICFNYIVECVKLILSEGLIWPKSLSYPPT